MTAFATLSKLSKRLKLSERSWGAGCAAALSTATMRRVPVQPRIYRPAGGGLACAGTLARASNVLHFSSESVLLSRCFRNCASESALPKLCFRVGVALFRNCASEVPIRCFRNCASESVLPSRCFRTRSSGSARLTPKHRLWGVGSSRLYHDNVNRRLAASAALSKLSETSRSVGCIVVDCCRLETAPQATPRAAKRGRRRGRVRPGGQWWPHWPPWPAASSTCLCRPPIASPKLWLGKASEPPPWSGTLSVHSKL